MAMRPATMAPIPTCWTPAPLDSIWVGPDGVAEMVPDAYPEVSMEAVGYGATGVAGTSGVVAG